MTTISVIFNDCAIFVEVPPTTKGGRKGYTEIGGLGFVLLF
jgi:hypothetical protein